MEARKQIGEAFDRCITLEAVEAHKFRQEIPKLSSLHVTVWSTFI